MKKRLSARAFVLMFLPLTLILGLLSLLQGPGQLSPTDILWAIGLPFGSEPQTEMSLADFRQTVLEIVFDLRLPRIMVTLFGGASLAIAGTVMQAVFRNPLASPDVLGTTQGSALGAAVAIALGLSAKSILITPLFAIVFALNVTIVVFAIAGGTKGISVTALLLAGIAMNTLMGAMIAFLMTFVFKRWDQSGEILYWLMGDLEKITYSYMWIVCGGFLLFSLFILPYLRDMDLLTLKDEGAGSLGVNVRTVRTILVFMACCLTAVTVSCTGGIAFVGLVVPHITRLLVGPAHRVLVPCAAIMGALTLTGSDYICRVLVPPDFGLRVGVVMAVLGAPFFLYLLARHRRGLAI